MNTVVEREIQLHRERIESLCRHFGVVRLRLFGSALDDSWDETRSDLDFLVEYGPGRPDGWQGLMGFQLEMEAEMRRIVDVTDWNSAKNPIFRKMADEAAIEIYAS